MKDFVKMVLAVICGLFILGIICFILFFGMIGSMAAAGSGTPSIPKDAVLKIDMGEITLAEQSSEEFSMPTMASLQGSQTATVGIWDAVRAINAAAEDNNIKYIYLLPEITSAGMGHIYEFRTALQHFRESGKPIISYMDNVSTGAYYLASVSDKVYMTSHDGITSMFHGISGQMIFLKDILDKLGVNVQLIRHGKYKSAGEMFVRNSSSPENMEQNQEMISSIWKEFLLGISTSRAIPVEELNALIDGLKLNFPQDFLDAKLVDGLLTKEELKGKLADLAVVDKFKDVKMVSFSDYVSAKATANVKAKKKIAVVYLDGDIVDGKAKQNIAGDRFANVLAKVRADSTVKAVVFRVNSPGGSVLASEKIRAEVELLKADKPVVASYGNYAASGGYWISAGCDHILSDPTTLTGSIGVFSMIPDFSKTMKDIAHVTYTPVKSNKHSDMMSLMRPLDADETAYMQASVERIYDRFVSLVAEGRNLTYDFVDGVAQGRVWTGRDALSIHLVDEIGTLEDAIKWAADAVSESLEESELKNWNIVAYPKPQTTMEQMMDMLGNKPSGEEIFSGTVLEPAAKALINWVDGLKDGQRSVMVTRMPYEIVWAD
ncbi:MAG: signal peptide peptidase SppA [Bacteroidales bacterium]|nr:signal peptide peptidase SppA [Bacteroidales bacterium]